MEGSFLRSSLHVLHLPIGNEIGACGVGGLCFILLQSISKRHQIGASPHWTNSESTGLPRESIRHFYGNYYASFPKPRRAPIPF